MKSITVDMLPFGPACTSTDHEMIVPSVYSKCASWQGILNNFVAGCIKYKIEPTLLGQSVVMQNIF